MAVAGYGNPTLCGDLVTAPPTIQTNPLDPVFSGVPVVIPQAGLVSPTWNKWFVDLREKVNVINSTLAAWSGITPVTGLTPGTYGDTTHYPIVTVNEFGLITGITEQAVSGGGGNPMKITILTGSHTISPTDAPATTANIGWLEQTASTSNVITIDTNANQNCPVGTHIFIRENTGGTTTINGVSGVTLSGPTITDGGNYSIGQVVQIALNSWAVFGNIPWTSGFTGTTLNPAATGTNLTLSGGNLVATNATTSYSSSISVAGKTSGKFYYELTTTQSSEAGGDDYIFGVSDASLGLNNFVGSDSHGWGIQGSAGTAVYFYHSGSYTTGSSSNWIKGSGYIVGCAFSGDGAGNWKVWYRDTTGAWLSGDPVAGTSPSFTISGVTTIYAAFSAKIHGSGNVIGTLNFGNTFHMTIPTGYSGIGA